MKLDIPTLQRLVAKIDTMVSTAQAELGGRPEWGASYGLRLAYDRRESQAGADLIRGLEQEDGARFRNNPPDGYALTIAGLRASCTGGVWGLLRNWQNAARRKIDEAQDACPGHVASEADAKVCSRCGIHIDDLRPDDGDGFNPHGSGPVPIEPRNGPTIIRGSIWYVGKEG